ncbi:tetratricopeptide repeat protein [Roseateles toxinivorans]|uniref:protein O-GlcNAc transferase n=1 Tax=Roseateles toxinivorans TaxID=270368 RepID=A0A4R6QKU5_9BURK|nr:tetratricopeptide repeat protein [Roseateles toxinivorans]TDP63957.1 putative O-linked N-acetylglucosamine transferase (SPINDLY family) [Roseateles toxinivorans]
MSLPPSVPAVPQAELQALFALFSARRHAEMEAHARALLLRHPRAGEVWKGLSVALLAQGRPAFEALQQAAALLPGDADLACNLGLALTGLGRLDEAAASLQRALALQPGFAVAHLNLGNVLTVQARWAEAAASYRHALQFNPNLVQAHFKLGIALAEQGQHVAAAASYREALRLKADHAEAHGSLANALQAQGRAEEALVHYRQAVLLQPGYALFHSNLAFALKELGRFDEAAASYRRALDLEPLNFETRSNLIFMLNYLPEADGALDEARQFGEQALRVARPFASWNCPPEPGRRLRVGLVSADLRNHPVGYFAQSVLAELGRDVDLVVYANQANDDAVSMVIRSHCQRWHGVRALSDEALAQLIHADAIDVLIDLAGHTAHNRLPVFAWKPAPVQLSWLGYCASTGLSTIDGFVGDPWITPPGGEAQFIEPVLRLPETFLCFTPPALDIAVGPLPALAQGCITFGCFNKPLKMNEAVVALWARVLQAVPGSRLLLKGGSQEAVREGFARHGIGPERLLLEGASPRAAYLAAYNSVDIALDPFPYPGGTTSVEGLWMGVPVLSLRGATALSRQGESLLQNLGLSDWVAADEDDYLARAVAHASDLPALAALRAGLRERLLRSPLCDAPRFAGHLDALLRQAWRGWCEGQGR